MSPIQQDIGGESALPLQNSTGPQAPSKQRKPSTNSENTENGWTFGQKALERFTSPAFLAFVLVAGLCYWALKSQSELDRLIKILAIVTPLVSAYAGYAFGKAR